MKRIVGIFISVVLMVVAAACAGGAPTAPISASPATTEAPSVVAVTSTAVSTKTESETEEAPATEAPAAAPTEAAVATEAATEQPAATEAATPPYPTPIANPVCEAAPLTADDNVAPVTDQDWVKGAADAEVTVIEYGDFQ